MTELLRTLYVTTPGTSLHLDNDAVRIYHPDQPQVRRLPLVRIDHIVAFGGITITDDLMHRCAADRRSVTWLTGQEGSSPGSVARRQATRTCAFHSMTIIGSASSA
jgi:CRISPR/Cas system-associated endonuclease Cas1